MYIPLFAAVSQIARPHNTSLIRVFAQDEMDKEVLSVDVSTSTDTKYSGMTLSIRTNATFNQSRMYYLEADRGMRVCICVVCGVMCVLCVFYVVSCVCVCMFCVVLCVCVCVCCVCLCGVMYVCGVCVWAQVTF